MNVSFSGAGSYGLSSSAVGGGGRRPDPAQMRQKLFGKIDTDGDGTISQSEFSSFAQKMAQHQSSAAGASGNGNAPSFSDFDTDGNGSISQSEFSSGMKKVEDQLNAQRQQKIFAKADSNGDGTVSQAELTSFVQSMAQHMHGHHHGGATSASDNSSADTTQSTASVSSLVSSLFSALDTDQSGGLSSSELGQLFQPPGQQQASSTGSSTIDSSNSIQAKLHSLMKALASQDGQDSSTASLSVTA